MNELRLTQWILPVVSAVSGYFGGKIFEYIVVRRLKKLAKQTAWRADDIFVDDLGNTATLWFVLAGLSGAVMTMPISPRLSTFLNTLLLIALVASATRLVARLAVNYVNIYAATVRGVLPSTTMSM